MTAQRGEDGVRSEIGPRADGVVGGDPPARYTSSPCLAQELDASGGGEPVDPRQRADVMRWRKAERERLIALRLATPSEDRLRWSQRIGAALEEAIGELRGVVVSFYSAFRGEPVLRDTMKRIVARGGHTALPIVVARGDPLA
ncbi:MAG: hypothetical protein ACRETB_04465, partial [Steroidobacteraceae bacterium]